MLDRYARAGEEVIDVVATVVAWIGAGLLVLAGIAKLRRPSATTAALRLVGLPEDVRAVRMLGLVEVVVGAAALAVGGIWFAALAALYLGFVVVVVRARTDATSCGCFGTEDEVPMTSLHLAVDVAVAVAAAAAVLVGSGLVEVVRQPDGWLVPGLVVLGVALTRTLLVDLPALADTMRRVEHAP